MKDLKVLWWLWIVNNYVHVVPGITERINVGFRESGDSGEEGSK